jgi:hypothetical protein
MDEVIVIPYKPRYPQDIIHPQLESHRFNVLVAHRRLGKTVLAVNHLIKMAATCEHEDARYAYIAPFLKQSKLIAWDYLKRYTAPIPGVVTREGDLIVELPNKSRIYLFGADNPDALRGTYLDGCVLDEYAQIKQEVFSEIIRPALSDRNGWCLFMGTPKGQNSFFEIYNHALMKMKDDASWWAGCYRGDETGVISEIEMGELKSVMAESTFRQEILCDFTAASDNVLITIDMVSNACARDHNESTLIYDPVIIGVDVARFGDDVSVIQVRIGKRADEPMIFKGCNNMELVGHLSHLCDRINPDAVFIDAGRGEGVIDRMRQLGYIKVHEINFGASPMNAHYLNKRMEMWDLMKEWIINVGQLPNIQELKADLVTPTYSFDAMNRMKLESKEDIKKRLGRSTDTGDALALTFAMPVIGRMDNIKRNVMPRVALR